jgi:hypothetical protein
MDRSTRIAAAGVCFAFAAALAPAGASAGPCSNDIAELSRILSASPALSGTPTTGALAGGMPGNTPSPAGGGGGAATSSPDRTAGTTADNRQGGTMGTRELNAVVGNQVATSPDDVRRQQEGRPTAAAAAEMGQRAQSDRQRVEVVPGAPGAAPGTDERMARAKADLESAHPRPARRRRLPRRGHQGPGSLGAQLSAGPVSRAAAGRPRP